MKVNYKKAVIHQSVDGVEMETEVLLPDIDEQEQQPIGLWGMRHLCFIKENRKPLYMELLTKGKLNGYLAEVDKRAQDMFYRLVEQLAEKEGVTEEIKASDSMRWVQMMNNIRNRAEEVVNEELFE